jgi:hypothetical protein
MYACFGDSTAERLPLCGEVVLAAIAAAAATWKAEFLLEVRMIEGSAAALRVRMISGVGEVRLSARGMFALSEGCLARDGSRVM